MRLVTLGVVSLSLAASACGKKPVAVDAAPATQVVSAADVAAAAADVAATPADVAAAPADAAPAPADAAPAPTDAAPAPVDAAAPADAAAVAPVVNPLEAKAKALLETWLAAQNKADYDAYAGLYAPRFTGIKRSGPRERTFALAGWLKDRKNMFKAAMKVEANDVQVMSGADTAVVTFVQTWASGTYQDKGRKQLVLVPNAGGLAIAREEMLASEIQAGDAAAKPVDPSLFSLLVPIDEKEANVVVPVDTLDASWNVGVPRLVQKTGPTIIVQAIDVAKLPDAQKAWLGKKMTTETGCTGAVDRLQLVGRFEPHFGTVQGWNGTADGENGKPLSDAEIARDAWGSGASIELVARIAGCSGGAFARDADKPAVAPYQKAAADPKRDALALAEFRKLSGWKAIQAEAKLPDSGVTTATWDVFDGAAPVVEAWTDASGTRTFVQVTASAGIGCGSFGGAFGAIFELGKGDQPTLVLLTDPEGGPTEAIDGVVDLDGDGEVEFYRDQGLIQRVGPIWKETLDITPPNYDCPC